MPLFECQQSACRPCSLPLRWRRSDYPGGLEILDAHHSPVEKWWAAGGLLVAGETDRRRGTNSCRTAYHAQPRVASAQEQAKGVLKSRDSCIRFLAAGLNRHPRRQITLSLTLHYPGSKATQPMAVRVSTSAHCRCRPGYAGAKLTAFIGRHPSPPTTTRVRARTAHCVCAHFPNPRSLLQSDIFGILGDSTSRSLNLCCSMLCSCPQSS